MPDPSADTLVVVTVDGGVGRLRLNRPEKRNALNEALSRAIIDGMRRLDDDPEVVVIVIEGTDGSFCAGATRGWPGGFHGTQRPDMGQIH